MIVDKDMDEVACLSCLSALSLTHICLTFTHLRTIRVTLKLTVVLSRLTLTVAGPSNGFLRSAWLCLRRRSVHVRVSSDAHTCARAGASPSQLAVICTSGVCCAASSRCSSPCR